MVEKGRAAQQQVDAAVRQSTDVGAVPAYAANDFSSLLRNQFLRCATELDPWILARVRQYAAGRPTVRRPLVRAWFSSCVPE